MGNHDNAENQAGSSNPNRSGVTPFNYTGIDEVVARLIAMTDGERRQVAAKLAQQAPALADWLAAELITATYENPPLGLVIGGPLLDFAE